MPAFEIRPYRLDDVEEVYAAADESRQHVGRWMSWMTPGYSIEDTRNWVQHAVDAREKGEAYEFLIIDSQTHAIVGSCGLNLFNKDNRFCNLGYWVRASRLGQGAARQATLALRDFGFSQLKLNRIEIVVADGNLPSQHVAQSVHALYEGLLHKRLTNQDRVYDAHMYALINQDSTK